MTCVQPSLTIVAVSISFLLAFGTTCLFQGQVLRAGPHCLVTPPSLGLFHSL
ncbi:MAG: hypothetical protein VKP70_10470 [Cyanobacteriota bacterium]|nr:hypothetical protein [Cyanobacteriota bacterium]